MTKTERASRLHAWRSRGDDPLVWIEYDAYAHRVFAGSRADWRTDPTAYTSALIQANAILGTQVLALPAAAPFQAVDRRADDPVDDLNRRFRAEEPVAFLANAIDALAHRMGRQADLALALPCPRDLLRANGADDGVAAGFDAQDDVALSVTDVLRALSGKPLSGLKLTFEAPPDDDDVAVCETIIHAARHYGWSVAVMLAHAATADDAEPARALAADAILLPEVAAADLLATDHRDLGGGLTRRFWEDDGDAAAGPTLLYGCVPAAAAPETVVRRVATLPRRAS